MTLDPRHALICATLLGLAWGCSSPARDDGTSRDTTTADQGAPLGARCFPSDESNPAFPGFAATEVNVEDGTSQCASGICLAANFQGRTDCPYGATCSTREGAPVTATVAPQLVARSPETAVYCSCRCDGPAGTGPFCACPGGLTCEPLVPDMGAGARALSGSYCLRAGTAVTDPASLSGGAVCDVAAGNCVGR
jgi:hypothetical protein